MSATDSPPLANGIARLECRIREASVLVGRAEREMAEHPDSLSRRLSHRSIVNHVAELQDELRISKEQLQHELIDLRLFAGGLRGSLPLQLAGRVAAHIDRALSFAAYHIRFGVEPAKSVTREIRDELDLRLTGLATGSTHLLVSGRISPDFAGESLLGQVLPRIFDILSDGDTDQLRDLITIIGARATSELERLLGVLEGEQVGAELTWAAPNAQHYRWGGSLEAVRRSRERLAVVTELKPEVVTFSGYVSTLSDRGAMQLRPSGTSPTVKIRYGTDQYQAVQQLHLGMLVTVRATKFAFRDEVTGEERAKYSLVEILD